MRPGPAEPSADAERDRRVEHDRGERSVALGAERDALSRRRPIAGVGLFAFAVENAAHRAAESSSTSATAMYVGVRRAVLRAEAAAHVVLDDANAMTAAGRTRSARSRARDEDALRRFPDGEASARPVGDGAVRLERRVQRDGRAILARDRDVGVAQSGVDVAARRRSRGELRGRLPRGRTSGAFGGERRSACRPRAARLDDVETNRVAARARAISSESAQIAASGWPA